MTCSRHLLKSSVLVILLLGLGKLTGLLRTRMLGDTFGTGPDFDAFTAANQLPEVFVTLISGGALAAAFIPVYASYLGSRSRPESARLASSILSLVSVVLGSVSALGIVAAPWLTSHLLVPEFTPELQILTAKLMRVILLQTTLFGISGVLSSILNAHQHFVLPALAPVALDVGYFLGIWFLVPSLGVFGLAWGTVIGGLLHILVQVPALLRYKFRYRWTLGRSIAGVREVVRLMGPRIITLGSVQIADLLVIRLTSGLPAGSTSGYFYGYYLMQLPETLLGTAIAIVIFPTMAELFNAGDIEGLKRTSMAALRIVWTLTVPAAIGLVLLGRPAIAFFLQQGAFDTSSTLLVYGVITFFSVRVVAEATLEIVARLFYAQHDTRTPMFAALGWLVLNGLLAIVLVGPMGVQGLALASTIAFSVQAAALFALNRRRLGALGERQLLQSLVRSLAAGLGMGLVIVLVGDLVSSTSLHLVTGAVAGLLTYFGLSFALGSRELPALFRLIGARAG